MGLPPNSTSFLVAMNYFDWSITKTETSKAPQTKIISIGRWSSSPLAQLYR